MPVLGDMIEAFLKSKGLNKSWFADELGVNKNQVTRWIQGENWPSHYIRAISNLIDAEDDQILAAARDFELNNNRAEKCQIMGSEIVSKHYDQSYKAFVRDLFSIDDYGIGRPQESVLSIDVWASLFRYTTDLWRVVVKNGLIVGDWHMLPVKPEQFEDIVSGRITETDINIDSVEFLHFPGDYCFYVPAITIRNEFRDTAIRRSIMFSMINAIEAMARDGFFIGKIAAVATTPEGKSLCKSIGMEPISENRISKEAVTFFLDGQNVSRSKIGEQSSAIAAMYRNHFKKR